MSDEEDEAKRAHELITALRNDGYDLAYGADANEDFPEHVDADRRARLFPAPPVTSSAERARSRVLKTNSTSWEHQPRNSGPASRARDPVRKIRLNETPPWTTNQRTSSASPSTTSTPTGAPGCSRRRR